MAGVRVTGFVSKVEKASFGSQYGQIENVRFELRDQPGDQYGQLCEAGLPMYDELVELQKAGKRGEFAVRPFGVAGKDGKPPWVKFVVQ